MTHRPHNRMHGGFTLIEVVIGLAIVGVLVLSYGTSLTAAVAARRIKIRNMAAALADIQLAALRTHDPTTVPVQTDGEPYGVLFSEGTWEVEEDGAASSGAQVFRTSAESATGVTSVYPLPENAYDDFTFTTEIKVDPGAPAGWQAGVFFRARDLQNGYRAWIDATSLTLERLDDGVVTTLHTDIRTVATDTWHTLEVTTNGSSISVDLNGLNVTNETDSTYLSGQAGLLAFESATVRFDDVVMDADTWDMESETLGEVPDGWDRFGLSSIPSGDMTLTTQELFGDSSFKRYTATVTWDDGSGQKTLSQSTDVND